MAHSLMITITNLLSNKGPQSLNHTAQNRTALHPTALSLSAFQRYVWCCRHALDQAYTARVWNNTKIYTVVFQAVPDYFSSTRKVAEVSLHAIPTLVFDLIVTLNDWINKPSSLYIHTWSSICYCNFKTFHQKTKIKYLKTGEGPQRSRKAVLQKLHGGC